MCEHLKYCTISKKLLKQKVKGRNVGAYETLNEVLVSLFRDVNDIEQKAIIISEFSDITNNDMHVIDAIGIDRPKNMSSIARELSVTVGTLTISVNSLVKKGYVVRNRSSEDRRVVFISLSEKGVKAYYHHKKFHEQMIDSVVKELTEEEIAKKEKQEKWMMNATVAISVVIAVAVFMVLPYFLSSLLKPLMPSYHLRTLVEGFVRIGIFILYIALISRMDDIQRTFMYHGAEHKCINCIEHGLPLTGDNVRISSRQHKRCGTSFLFFVLAISIILLMLIQVESPLMRVIVRIALIPVIAGISYEVLKLAGRSENPIINLLSRPGLAIQKLTTKEPDDSMIEVAIQAVEAVFDWRAYEAENFKTAEDL